MILTPQQALESPLTWGRGLKHRAGCQRHMVSQSPLTWGRGLKLEGLRGERGEHVVAPHVGAWIETLVVCPFNTDYQSPLTWGRGLKQENH